MVFGKGRFKVPNLLEKIGHEIASISVGTGQNGAAERPASSNIAQRAAWRRNLEGGALEQETRPHLIVFSHGSTVKGHILKSSSPLPPNQQYFERLSLVPWGPGLAALGAQSLMIFAVGGGVGAGMSA